MKIILESNIKQDEYTEYVCNSFDLQNSEKTVTEVPMLDMDEVNGVEWNILLILGNSGSGKSTILRSLGDLKTPTYDNNKSVISQFNNLSPQDASDLLCSVGLSSVPTWLRKPNQLSNGEKARLDICWHINQSLVMGEPIIIDEYSSVVNRDTAKSLSFALQRYLRTHNMKAIIASCHFDLMEWLQPDLVFNINKLDKDGECELERFIYSDDKDYVAYNAVNEQDKLSEEIEIK